MFLTFLISNKAKCLSLFMLSMSSTYLFKFSFNCYIIYFYIVNVSLLCKISKALEYVFR